MTNRQIIKLLMSFARPYRKTVVILIINTFLTVLLTFFISPIFLSQVLMHFQDQTISLATTWPLIIGYATTQIIGGIIGWRVSLWLAWKFETKAQVDIYNRVFDKLVYQSIDFHSDKFGGSLVS